MKVWRHHEDKILSTLATDMLDRHIFKVEVSEEPFEASHIETIAKEISALMDISIEDAKHYMMSINTISKDMYNVVSEASELLNVQLLSKKIRKYYLTYQRFE